MPLRSQQLETSSYSQSKTPWLLEPSQEEILLRLTSQVQPTPCSWEAPRRPSGLPQALPVKSGDLLDCQLISPFLDSPFLGPHAAE